MLSRFGTSQLVVAGVLLVGFGLVMVYSASAARSEVVFGTSLAYPGASRWRSLSASRWRPPASTPRSRGSRRWGFAWGASVLAIAATFTPLGASVTARSAGSPWVDRVPAAEPAKLGVVLGLAQGRPRQSELADYRVSVLVPGARGHPDLCSSRGRLRRRDADSCSPGGVVRKGAIVTC
jgi:hypothetical protein